MHAVDEAFCVVEVAGEVDVYTAPELRRELLRVVDDGATSLVVDLTSATFVDSFLLGVLLGVLKRVRSVCGRMILVCSEPSSRRVFEITLLDHLFPIYDTRAEALAELGKVGEGRELPIEPAEHVV